MQQAEEFDELDQASETGTPDENVDDLEDGDGTEPEEENADDEGDGEGDEEQQPEAPKPDSEIDRLRAENERLRSDQEKLITRITKPEQPTEKPAPRQKVSGEQLMDMIQNRGEEALEDVLRGAGFVSATEVRQLVKSAVDEYGEQFSQGFIRDNQLLDEFPDLKNPDSEFTHEARDYVKKFNELGPEAGLLYLAATAVKNKRAAASAKPKPSTEEVEINNRIKNGGGKAAKRAGGNKSSDAGMTPGMRSVLRNMGIKD